MDDRSEILSIMKTIYKGMELGDFQATFEHMTDDINAIGTTQDEIVFKLDDIKVKLTTQTDQQTNDQLTIKLNIDKQVVKIIGGNAAFGLNLGKLQIKSKVGDLNLDFRETLIFEKLDGRWKCCHLHASHPFIVSQENTPYPKIETISDHISQFLKGLEIDTPSLLIKKSDKKSELIKYLKHAKEILEAENLD